MSSNVFQTKAKFFSLIILVSTLHSCSQIQYKKTEISTLDAKFLSNTLPLKTNRKSDYKSKFSKTVYSRILKNSLPGGCTNFPSDSSYASIMLEKCGFISSWIKTTARYIREYDAPFTSKLFVKESHGLHFIDTNFNCL